MLADMIRENNLGKITKHVMPNASISAVVKFVEQHLPEFAIKAINYRGEKNLTDYLFKLLSLYTHQEYCAFRFSKDDPQDIRNGNCATVDIGVQSNEKNGIIIDSKGYRNDESFFSFEAKRLKRMSKQREQEYLVGRYYENRYLETGGVERFKKEIHGKQLKFSGMIGYMQEQDYTFWHKTLNSWIDELIINDGLSEATWNEEDKLIEENINVTARYKSINQRITKEKIILYHLWVNLQI